MDQLDIFPADIIRSDIFGVFVRIKVVQAIRISVKLLLNVLAVRELKNGSPCDDRIDFFGIFVLPVFQIFITLFIASESVETLGNCLPLSQIPLGLMVHAIELVPGRGAKVARSAGNSCQIMARDGGKVTLKMPSGEIRMFDGRCLACVGSVGNKDWSSISLGKAGRKRYLGIRPTVRGVAMNPVDHPMGGGEGRTSGGSHPRSPWGQLAKGGKTRAKRKASDKLIVKRRK